MFDLTIQLEVESESVYRDVCLKLRQFAESAEGRGIVCYRMLMSEDNSASSLFVGQPHSVVVDAKSGTIRVTHTAP